jgi:hypothetical protein
MMAGLAVVTEIIGSATDIDVNTAHTQKMRDVAFGSHTTCFGV